MKNYFKYVWCIVILSAFAACGSSSNKKDGDTHQETKTASQTGGKDLLIIYEFQSESDEGLQPSGTARLYISDKAIRSEMKMQVHGQDMNMVMLAKMNKPDQTILLNTA